MKSSPLHFGVIGTSGITSTHLEELRKLMVLGEAKIVAVTDLDEEKGKLAAAVYQCDYYPNYRELLKRKDIDVINICVPSGLHSDVTIEAARSGKHVIVEKPMDISLAKAESMIQECNNARVTLSVIMQNRFAPAVQQVKSALEQGRLGQPLLINASVNWYRSQAYYDISPWRGTWAMDGGGAVINQGRG
ncbi:Gfo/Idh/MocA family oxidoreductase [Neobacillus pocheonensis]